MAMQTHAHFSLKASTLFPVGLNFEVDVFIYDDDSYLKKKIISIIKVQSFYGVSLQELLEN